MWNHLKTQAEFIIKSIQKELKIFKKRNYIKRKLASTENENKSKQIKRLKCNSQDSSITALHETSDDTRLPTSIPKAIEFFHKNIRVGPETFVRVVTSYGINHLSFNVMLLYISRVQEKFSLYALLV